MEDDKYKTIEEQALQIVGTLNRLKEEIEGYKDVKVETQSSLDSLDALLGAVTDAAKQLSSAAKDLKKSDYVKLHKEISEETEVFTSACETLQKNLDEIPAKVEEMLESHQTKQKEAISAFADQVGKAYEADAVSREAMQKEIEVAFKDVTDRFSELPAVLRTSLETHNANQIKKDEELLDRIANLTEIIARIDRNTQKGFGKERG